MADNDTKTTDREKELLEKIATLSSENENLIKKVSELEAQVSEYETVKGRIEARDSLLWKRFEDDVNRSVPEKMRDMFKRENFADPVEAFSNLTVFVDMLNTLKEEVVAEQKAAKKDSPVKKPIEGDNQESYTGNSRAEALRLLAKLNKQN